MIISGPHGATLVVLGKAERSLGHAFMTIRLYFREGIGIIAKSFGDSKDEKLRHYVHLPAYTLHFISAV